MDLQIKILASASRHRTGKGTLVYNSVLPRKRKDVLRGHIIQFDFSAADDPPSVYFRIQPGYARHIGRCAEPRFHLLHLVDLDPEVVGFADGIEKLLLPLSLQRDFNLLVHKEVSPVLRYFFPHPGGIPATLNRFLAVEHPVAVEIPDVSVIPGLPQVNVAVKILRDGIIALVFKDFVNIQCALSPPGVDFRAGVVIPSSLPAGGQGARDRAIANYGTYLAHSPALPHHQIDIYAD